MPESDLGAYQLMFRFSLYLPAVYGSFYCVFIVYLLWFHCFYKMLSPCVYHWKLQSANQVLLMGNSLNFDQITECISIAGEVKAELTFGLQVKWVFVQIRQKLSIFNHLRKVQTGNFKCYVFFLVETTRFKHPFYCRLDISAMIHLIPSSLNRKNLLFLVET